MPFLLRELQGNREGGGRASLQGMRDDVAQSVCERVGWYLSELSTDERVEVFEKPKVPKGQVVIKVEGEEGGSGGEEEVGGKGEGVGKKASGGGTWRTCGVGRWVYRAKLTGDLKRHKAAIYSIDIVCVTALSLGASTGRRRRAISRCTEPSCTILV